MFEFVFKPIFTWPGPMTAKRKQSQFRSSYHQTIHLLESELVHLRARNIVVQLALMPNDIRRDGLPRAGARPAHPGIIVAFDSRYGPLSYPCDRFDDWQDNLRAVALSLEHLRAVDRYGVTKRGEQYRGWEQLPSPEAKPAMFVEEAQRILDGYGGETKAIMATHPDRGGNGDDFERVQKARKVLGLA